MAKSNFLKPCKIEKSKVRLSYPKYLILLFFCFVFAVPANAQEMINVSGTILDEAGEPVIGASVQPIGMSTGTVSDIDGKFSISTPSDAQLRITYLGYSEQIVNVDKRTTISITLKEDTEMLEEVVVIGYGTVKRKDLTGAVASVKSGDITIAPTSNAMEALQGRVSGLDISKTSGQISDDGGVEILLRGNRSIYGGNNPLFIIDGIIGSYNQVNPSDIESIDVLKDASSTAIYGAAGANGVIIITTKRGKAGKATVNFDAYVGFSGSPEFPRAKVGNEWTTYQRESYKYKNGQYPADMSAILTDAKKYEAYQNNRWIDWVDEALGNTAVNQKYNISVTGGGDKTKIFSSLTYDRDEGLLSNESRDRYAFRLNLDQQIFSWAKAGFTSNVNYSIRDNGVKNTFTQALSAFPLGDAYDVNGNLNHEFITNEYSPLGDFIENQFVDNTRNTYVNANAYLELTPIKGFSFKTIISGTLNNARRGQYWGDQSNANRPSYAGSPHASITNTYRNEYLWDNIINYNKTFGEDHDLGLTALSSWIKAQYEDNMSAGSGQLLDSWSFYSMMSSVNPHVESSFNQRQKMSYAFRLNYSFKGKYLFTFSNRWDGVSWFSPGHKWDSFPAGALAWRISDENFMENSRTWLSNLKLRVGYGITGNPEGGGPYRTQTNLYNYSANGITINGKVVPFIQYVENHPNSNLGWEKSYNANVGLDFGLLKGRINGSIEWFYTRTKDLLYQRTMPITTGVPAWGSPLKRWENIAETSNRGIEISINSNNIATKDFNWNTDLTFGWTQDRIESLPSGNLISENLFVGESIKSFYDYKYAGIWGSNTSAEDLAAYGVKPGWLQLATNPQISNENGMEVNDGGVHKYSETDKMMLGHLNPDFVVGLNNTFSYKWFDLSVFMMSRSGQTIKSNLLGRFDEVAGADYWTEKNQGAYFPVAGLKSSNEQSAYMSALQYRDGSFIKIKNITVGYTLPKHLSRVALMQKCRFYFTAYNPVIWVKDKQLKGTDPEMNGSDGFPTFKQFVFGVNLTF